MKMNEMYEAPVLEVLNVAVESGFQSSTGIGDMEEGGDA